VRVLVTGASRGIGAGLRAHYADLGHEVLGTCRGAPPADGHWIAVDLTDPDAERLLSRGLGDRPLDLLICNAGLYPDKGDTIDTGFASEAWAEAFAVNVTGVFRTVRALLPNLRAADAGRIAILGSTLGCSSRPGGGSYIYRASKAAVHNLGRNLATDLAGDGIAVGIYHPGWVRTAMGGPQAGMDVAAAVAGLTARIDALDMARTGIFASHDGTILDF